MDCTKKIFVSVVPTILIYLVNLCFKKKIFFYTDILLMKTLFSQKNGLSSLGDKYKEGIDVSCVAQYDTGDNGAV